MEGVSCVWGRVWRGASVPIGGSGSADRWWPPPSPSSQPQSPGSGRTPAGLQQHTQGGFIHHGYHGCWLVSNPGDVIVMSLGRLQKHGTWCLQNIETVAWKYSIQMHRGKFKPLWKQDSKTLVTLHKNTANKMLNIKQRDKTIADKWWHQKSDLYYCTSLMFYRKW